MKNKDQLEIAIVGAGGIGRRHAACYAAHPNARVAAVCDLVPEAAASLAGEHDARPFASVAELLQSGLRIDAASVCTAGEENGGDHYQPTMELLGGGIPVLGEKPISNRIPEAREMVALAREKKLPYAINLNHRFTPAAARAREWLEAGRLGELHFVNMRMWISNNKESSPHFHMRALHPHSIDVMRYFGGDIVRVQAFFKKGKGRTIWSNAQVNVLFKSGAIGHLLGSYDGGGPGKPWGLETCEVIGSDARVTIEDACEELIFSPRFTPEKEIYHCLGGMRSFGETFTSRIGVWIDDLIQGTPPDQIQASGEEALKAQLVIEAAIESWEKNTVVEVEE